MPRGGELQDPLADYKVHQITVLPGRDGAAEARALLESVAKQVQPIMRRRRWRVPVLSEFAPKNPNLLGLNVNRGAEVKIRLRPARAALPGDEARFYPYNHVLGTMLHELVHIVHGRAAAVVCDCDVVCGECR
jgi:hypothetical protein